MTNNNKETEIATKDSRLRLNLPRKVLFLVIATIVIWALGIDEWIEYYIELGIYHYKFLAPLSGIIFLRHSR